MHYLIVSASTAAHSTSNARRTWTHSADYTQALHQYRKAEGRLAPAGFVLLAELKGAPSPHDLARAADQLSPRDDTVIRSAIGATLAETYTEAATLDLTLTPQDYATINAHKYLLLRLIEGQPATSEELISLGGLVTLLENLQDSASQQGVPDGVIWPGVPFGAAVDLEAQLSSDPSASHRIQLAAE